MSVRIVADNFVPVMSKVAGSSSLQACMRPPAWQHDAGTASLRSRAAAPPQPCMCSACLHASPAAPGCARAAAPQVLGSIRGVHAELELLRDRSSSAWDALLRHFGETRQSCASDTEFWADMAVRRARRRRAQEGAGGRSGRAPPEAAGLRAAVHVCADLHACTCARTHAVLLGRRPCWSATPPALLRLPC